jgi:hypothetical protein
VQSPEFKPQTHKKKKERKKRNPKNKEKHAKSSQDFLSREPQRGYELTSWQAIV